MKSTMQDAPLSIARLLRYGSDRARRRPPSSTWTGDGVRSRDLRRGRRAGRPARARAARARRRRRPAGRHLHVQQQRAPRGLPRRARRWARCCTRSTSGCSPSSSSYIVNHAEDHVVIVDAVAGPGARQAAARADDRPARRRRRARRRPVGARRRPTASRCTTTRSCSPAGRRRSTGRTSTSAPPRRSVTRAARPATPRASSTRTARSGCTRMQVCMTERFGLTDASTRARRRAAVPRDGLGAALRGVHVRRLAADAGPVPAGRAAGRDDRGSERPDVRRRGADDLERPPALPRRATAATSPRCGRSSSAGRPARRR